MGEVQKLYLLHKSNIRTKISHPSRTLDMSSAYRLALQPANDPPRIQYYRREERVVKCWRDRRQRNDTAATLGELAGALNDVGWYGFRRC